MGYNLFTSNNMGLLLLVISFLSYTNTTISLSNNNTIELNKNDDNATSSSNCTQCKGYTIRGAGGATAVAPPTVVPPAEPTEALDEKKPNVGAVVVFTVLLVFVLVGAFVCLCRMKESRRRHITQRLEAVVQHGVSKEKKVSSDIKVERVIKHVDEIRQNGEINGLEKKPQEVVEPKIDKVENKIEKKKVVIEKQPQSVVVKEKMGYSLVLPKKYSFRYIKFLTNNFDKGNLIGEGGFGEVYKGALVNGTIVAIKRLNLKHGVNDFKNEVEALGQTSHFNLVKLIGYCAENEHRMLVYEYISNGTLQEWIFGTNPERSFSWPEMKKVILGIVKGLVYLHENCEKKILHRDLKPANILVDKNKNAKLCDFGIAKLLERDQSSTYTVGLGTHGYVALEVLKGMNISEKVDVYSFGIVTLEVLFGKRYRQLLLDTNQTNLAPNQLSGLIKNLNMEMRENEIEIESIGYLALLCLKENPIDRPTMSEILSAIKRIDRKARIN